MNAVTHARTPRRSLRVVLASCAVLLAIAFLACGPKIDPLLVRHWAASDFDCDDRIVDVERVGDPSRYRARGCGHSMVYDCGELADGGVKCAPVSEIASGGAPPGTGVSPSACDCSHPHSSDSPGSSPPPATPIMPQKPYRQ